ncbi:MAG: hypothetical protein J5J06_06775, partial [Phycisphaerae bacterium]|nr:hypothetical protein [Phycisphaerae bacterium]
WIAAAHVQPGDHLDHACGMAVAVVDRVYDPSPTFVYDLTVDGTWTFFAGELWVHNCPVKPHNHHAWPKFLDGPEDGLTVSLDPSDHLGVYHSGLRRALSDAGIRFKNLQKGESWLEYLRRTDQLSKAQNVMMDYTRRYDSKFGTTLTNAIWETMFGDY